MNMSKELNEGVDDIIVNFSSNISSDGHLSAMKHQRPIVVGSTIGSQLGSPVSVYASTILRLTERFVTDCACDRCLCNNADYFIAEPYGVAQRHHYQCVYWKLLFRCRYRYGGFRTMGAGPWQFLWVYRAERVWYAIQSYHKLSCLAR